VHRTDGACRIFGVSQNFGVTAQSGAQQAPHVSRWVPWAWSVRKASKVLESCLRENQPKFQARDNQLPLPSLLLGHFLLYHHSLAIARQACTMADALKAEGNKAFAAKNFGEAAYVQAATLTKLLLTYICLTATNSHKPSSSTRRIMFSTPTAPALMLA
jgi:hypothetical protein